MKNENRVRKRRLWIRILAIFLVLTMIVSYCATSLISIKIVSDPDNAALSYLADNTEYVNQNSASRLMTQIGNKIGQPVGFTDYYELASSKIAETKYKEALPYVNQCINLISKDSEPDKYVDLMIKKGCLLTLIGRGEEAITPLREALELKSDSKEIYLVLAQIYYDQNNFEGLGEVLKAYLELESEDVDTRVTYAQALYSNGDFENAKEQFNIVEASVSGDNQTMTNEVKHYQALIELQLGDFENAYIKLCEMDGLENSFPDILTNKGLCKMGLGEYKEAVEFYTTSIEKGQQVQYCYYTRGICEITGEEPDYEAAYNDLVMAAEYEGEDRDEETAALARELIEQAFAGQS